MHDAFSDIGLKNEYADALGAMRKALKIRNEFSHCHWMDLSSPPAQQPGLFYVRLGESALPSDSFKYEWHHAEIGLLKEMEEYCFYARLCLIHLDFEWDLRKGTARNNSVPMPKKRPPPKPHIVTNPHTLALLPRGL